MIHLGWRAGSGSPDDLAFIRERLQRLVRDFPQMQFVRAGAPNAMSVFESLPENRLLWHAATTGVSKPVVRRN